MQAVFSRPWTRLFVQSHKDKEVADRDTVGHRGTPDRPCRGGAKRRTGHRPAFGSARPGAAAARRLADRSAGPGQTVRLPGRSALAVRHGPARQGERGDSRRRPGRWSRSGCRPIIPPIPVGAPVYCSSSQDVKRRYRHSRPKPGLYRVRRRRPRRSSARRNRAGRDRDRIAAAAWGRIISGAADARRTIFARARCRRDGGGGARRVREAGAIPSLSWTGSRSHDPDTRFVPVSRLNQAAPRPGGGACSGDARRRCAATRRSQAACGFATSAAKPQPLASAGPSRSIASASLMRSSRATGTASTNWSSTSPATIRRC